MESTSCRSSNRRQFIAAGRERATTMRSGADQITDAHEEGGHRGKQHGCAEITHGPSLQRRGGSWPALTSICWNCRPITSIGRFGKAPPGIFRGPEAVVSRAVTLTVPQELASCWREFNSSESRHVLDLACPPLSPQSLPALAHREQKRQIAKPSRHRAASDLVARLFY